VRGLEGGDVWSPSPPPPTPWPNPASTTQNLNLLWSFGYEVEGGRRGLGVLGTEGICLRLNSVSPENAQVKLQAYPSPPLRWSKA
jgi:hypothetical protein